MHCPDCYMGGDGAWDCGHEQTIDRLQQQVAMLESEEALRAVIAERDALREDLRAVIRTVIAYRDAQGNIKHGMEEVRPGVMRSFKHVIKGCLDRREAFEQMCLALSRPGVQKILEEP